MIFSPPPLLPLQRKSELVTCIIFLQFTLSSSRSFEWRQFVFSKRKSTKRNTNHGNRKHQHMTVVWETWTHFEKIAHRTVSPKFKWSRSCRPACEVHVKDRNLVEKSGRLSTQYYGRAGDLWNASGVDATSSHSKSFLLEHRRPALSSERENMCL